MMTDVEASSSGEEAWKGVTLKYAGKEFKIGEDQVPYVLIVVGSIMLLIEAINVPMNREYAISVAVVSMVFAMVATAMSLKMEALWNRFGIYLAYFLLLWNGVGVIILTFKGPFIATNNGYFAIWAMMICSVIASKAKYGIVTNKLKNANAMGGLSLSANVLMIAILFFGFYDWKNIYALIIAVLTQVVCAIFVFLESRGDPAEGVKLPVLSIFACLWVIVVILLTFAGGLFNYTSNGYFAAWGGCIFSVYAACTC